MRTLLLITIFLILMCSSSFGQEKPSALKFDEFEMSSYGSNWENVKFRLNRFAKELKKHPQMKAVIIGYDSRKQNYGEYWVGDNRILTYQRELEQNGVTENRIQRIFGGVRENESLELWLLPKNADLPKANPHFQNSQIVYCPTIWMTAPFYTLNKSPLEFSADIQRVSPSTKFTYKWQISSGQIISGQGTDKILLDISNVLESNITVKLVVEGLNLECKNEDIKTTRIASFPFKLNEFDSNYNEAIKLTLHLVSIEQNENPNLEHKIFVYASRKEPLKSKAWGMKELNKLMDFMRFPKEKISIEFGGYRESLTFEVWAYPKGAKPPNSSPTVDAGFIIQDKTRSLHSPN